MAFRRISVKEVALHNTTTDIWLIVDGKVYDVTDFAPDHPGGTEIIQRYAGKDASEAYNAIHAPSVIKNGLPLSKHLGDLDLSTLDGTRSEPPSTESKPTIRGSEKPPLETLINTSDFEIVASKVLTTKAWAFYSSAATDQITRDANRSMFNRLWFRPRVLVDVSQVDTRTSMMGCPMELPVFVSPAALARMAHPEGEKELARGVEASSIPQCISTNASFPVEEIVAAVQQNHPFFFQLYVNKNRKVSEALLAKVKSLGVKGLMVTVDASMPGKREADERAKADENMQSPMTGDKARNDKKGGGLGRVMGQHIDPKLKWDDLEWLRSITDLPIILKGIMSGEDAKLAMQHHVDGIVLSNHGGRNLDTSPPAVLVLLDLQKNCPEIFDTMEVYVDGGIRRGTDILKCLCLGATAVGLGRSFLYSLVYGQEGVKHIIEILRDELATAMALVGITDVSQCRPGLVNTGDVDHLIPTGDDHPYAKWTRNSTKISRVVAKL